MSVSEVHRHTELEWTLKNDEVNHIILTDKILEPKLVRKSGQEFTLLYQTSASLLKDLFLCLWMKKQSLL